MTAQGRTPASKHGGSRYAALLGSPAQTGKLTRLKCLFVIDSLGSGGAQRQMVTLAQALNARGHDITIFTYYPQHQHLLVDVRERGISVVSETKKSRYTPRVVLALRRLIRRGGHDIILSYLDTPNLYAELANLRMQRSPLVVSERSTFPLGRMPLRTYALQQAHRLADAVVVNSYRQGQRMVHQFPWMRNRLRIITNGVDLERFAPAVGRSVLAGPNETEVRLLAIGNIVANKNACGLMKALVVLQRANRVRVRVRWAGKRSMTAAGQLYFASAEKLLRENGLTEQWEWLGERTDIPELLRDHDALIHPSFYEGMSNAVCEALACGRPVLASDVSDHRRMIQHGVTGLLFNPASPEDIAAAIERFACQSSHSRELAGRSARRFAEEMLSQEGFVDAYEGLFNELLIAQ